MSNPRRAIKIANRVFLGFIILAIISRMTFDIVPLEFQKRTLRTDYQYFFILGTPISFFALIILDYIKNRTNRLLLLNLFFGGVLAVISGFIMLFIGSWDIDPDQDRTLFQHRFKEGLTIISRKSYYPDSVDTLKLKSITPWFHWATDTDIETLDPNRWSRPAEDSGSLGMTSSTSH